LTGDFYLTYLSHLERYIYEGAAENILLEAYQDIMRSLDEKHAQAADILDVHTRALRKIMGVQRDSDNVQWIYIDRATEFLAQILIVIDAFLLQLKERMERDPLTGLYNRRFLVRRLEEEINRAMRHERPLCAMLIDIDDFKQINDQYGHNSGDTVLQKIADLLDRAKRASDIAGRYGGDEFCIVFPDTDLTGVGTVSDRLRGMMDSEEIVLPGGDRVSLRISFGAAQWDGREDLARFMDRADRALYRIKREE